MTLSLSSCVRPLVPEEFFLSLKSFNGVLRKLKGCLKFEGCFKEVSKMFQVSLKGV